jgi:hypothetical protein
MTNTRRRKRKQQSSGTGVLLIVIGVIMLLGAGGLTWYLLRKDKGKKGDENTVQANEAAAGPELKKAIAETDKSDPKWRLEDIAAAQPKLDASKNGATFALNAAKQLQQNFGAALDGVNTRLDPSQPIPDFDVQRLRQVVQANGQALTEARKVASAPQGRYEIQFNLKKPLDTLLPQQQESRKAAQILVYDSELRAAERDGNNALQSAYAVLTVARYIDSEPFLICQLVRAAESGLAISALERAMTCANVPDKGLQAMQQLLESEATANPLYWALRGERASFHAMVINGNDGAKMSESDHAWGLRALNRAIDLAAKRTPANSSAWATLDTDLRKGSADALRLMPAFDKVRKALTRAQANVSTAAVALAAERYRRDKGEWPADLKDLVPKYLKQLPPDPYTGGALKYAKHQQGITVYALGPNVFDFKGTFNTIGFQENENSGFRLLQPNLRR